MVNWQIFTKKLSHTKFFNMATHSNTHMHPFLSHYATLWGGVLCKASKMAALETTQTPVACIAYSFRVSKYLFLHGG